VKFIEPSECGEGIEVLLMLCYSALFIAVIIGYIVLAVLAFLFYWPLGLALFPGVPAAIIWKLGVER
jgi:hypothetical protein